MKNANTSDWFINLMLVVLTAVAMFLIGLTFTQGKGEGDQMRAKYHRHR